MMKIDELLLRQRQQGVGSTAVVREFHFKTAVRMNLNDRADLTADQPFGRKFVGKSDDVQ
jgi:hypothetical protein